MRPGDPPAVAESRRLADHVVRLARQNGQQMAVLPGDDGLCEIQCVAYRRLEWRETGRQWREKNPEGYSQQRIAAKLRRE